MRIGGNMKKILIQNLNKLQEKLKQATQIEVIDITYVNEDTTLQEILNQEFKKSDKALKGELVLMSELSEEEMDQVSHILKEEGVQPIQAVVTAHNRTWTIVELNQELEKERQMFHLRNELIQHLTQFNKLKNISFTSEEQQIVMQTFMYIQTMQASVEQLENLLMQLKQIEQKYLK